MRSPLRSTTPGGANTVILYVQPLASDLALSLDEPLKVPQQGLIHQVGGERESWRAANR